MEIVEKSEIKAFLKHHLFNSSNLESEMTQHIFHMLHNKGKIFYNHEPYFSWGEFYAHVSSFHWDEDTCKQSIMIHAAAIELLILATDIFDEISDQDQGDRMINRLTIGEAITIANALMMESFRLLLKCSPKHTYDKFTVIIDELQNACNGQWKDLHFVISDTIPTEEDYFLLVQQKSASLVKLVCTSSHIQHQDIWGPIANCIGIAGQLKNDAKDILSDDKSDLMNKKATLPLIKAMEYSLKKDRGWLLKKLCQLKANEPCSSLLFEIKNYIRKTGAIDYCFILSKLYINEAIKQLSTHFPEKHILIHRLQSYLES
jgi:competence protein ComQ